jgi:hypothetical protein
LLDTNVVASLSPPNGAPSVRAWAASQDERRFHLSLDKGIHQLPDDDLPDYSLTAGALAKAMGLKDRTRVEHLIR